MVMAFPPAGIGWLLRRITHHPRAGGGEPKGEWAALTAKRSAACGCGQRAGRRGRAGAGHPAGAGGGCRAL